MRMMRTIRRPAPNVQAESVRRWTPVGGRRPAISNAGNRRIPTTRMNAAAATIRSGPRTCGLEADIVSRTMARNPAPARLRATRAAIHAATSVGTSANSTASGLIGPSNNRVHMTHSTLSWHRHSAKLRIVSRILEREETTAFLRANAVRKVLGAELRESLKGHTKAGATPLAIVAVFQKEAAAVRFRDLSAQYETNAGTARFRGEEGHEQVSGVRQPGPFILDPQFHRGWNRPCQPLPSDCHAAAGFTHGVDGIPNEVDEQLFELIAGPLDRQPGPRGDKNVVRLFKRYDAIHERA